MKNILFPTDYSQNAQNGLAYALNIAKRFKANVNLLHILENTSIERTPHLKTPTTEVITKDLPDSKLTNFVKQTLDSKRLNAPVKNRLSFELGSGKAESEIRIRSSQYDFLVMGKKGTNSISEKLFGGVTTSLLKGAECPVLVVPEKVVYQPVKNLLFADNYQAITTDSVHNIIEIAERFNARLHFVHVKDGIVTEDTISESLLEEILTLARVPKIPFEVNIIDRQENTNNTLENYVKEHNIDMIAMVRSHHNIFKSLFLESHTRSMCYSTDIPLLSLPGKSK